MNNLKCYKLIPVSVRLFFIGLAIAGFTGEASAQQAFCTEGSVIDCAGECDGKKIFDECKVCDGSGKTNYNTAQAGTVACCPPGSPSFVGLPDDCGKCGGSNGDKDDCGKCFGSGKESFQTSQAGAVACCPAGTPGYVGPPDDCGECGGKNDRKDECGKCGGSGKVNGCCPEGTPNFSGNPDACGVCGGNSQECCPTWGVQVNRAEGSSANEDWFNPNTSFFPQCATSTIESALTECGNDEACANQKVFEGQIISLSEDEGVVIFDKQCNAISKTEEEVDDNQGEDNDGDGKGGNKDKDGADSKALPDQCIFAVIKYDSPISLLVEDESVLTTDATLVQFPLDPNAPTNWVEWRGSAKAPLLVFDPTHSGNITRADQLFGHWTFGGQAQASLNGSLAATPWKNGYEALGTLDLNNDGQISGSELSDLGLWFDNNQDAVTQAGEVKPVTEAGVDALYYKNPTQPEDSRNLYLSVGYRGSLAGQGQIGTSVDWFARSAQSRHELLAELLAGTGELELETSTEDQQSPQNQPGVTTLKHSPLRGVYTWKEAIDDPTAGQGLLTFNEVAPGKVTGLSATEMEINKEWAAKTGGERALAFRRFEGTITRDGDSASVSFIIEGQATRTVSTMALTPNGATAQGSSEVTSRIKSGERKAVKYTWNAQRILAK